MIRTGTSFIDSLLATTLSHQPSAISHQPSITAMARYSLLMLQYLVCIDASSLVVSVRAIRARMRSDVFIVYFHYNITRTLRLPGERLEK
jgi:hypothetical protein